MAGSEDREDELSLDDAIGAALDEQLEPAGLSEEQKRQYARDEQGRFEAEQLGRFILKGIDGRIVAEDIVANAAGANSLLAAADFDRSHSDSAVLHPGEHRRDEFRRADAPRRLGA